VWIEVALNGPWGRERQPRIPVTVDEIVADGITCAEAGCAIVHVHAYDESSGRQRDDWEIYARIIEGIRARVDAIVYPTIPLAGSNRFAHVEELARRGLIEWTVLDPGSVNFARFAAIGARAEGFVYENSPAELSDAVRIVREYGLHPGYAIYEPGFTRLGAALAKGPPPSPAPIYRFMFSEEWAWGFSPRPVHLDAHLALLAESAPGAAWMIAGLGVDIRPLIPHAIARGGHLRVGLEDAPSGSELSNGDWVQEALAAVRSAGGEPASAADVRAALSAGAAAG
jgi:uncharacterized protein (DUF849 family)